MLLLGADAVLPLLTIAPAVPDIRTHAINASIFVFMYYLLFMPLDFEMLQICNFLAFIVTPMKEDDNTENYVN